MMKHGHHGHGSSHGKCYGSTVMGERGQVVIPAEAREEIGIQAGEKMIVFGNPKRGTVILIKSDIMARFADLLFKKSNFFDELLGRKDKNNSDEDDE